MSDRADFGNMCCKLLYTEFEGDFENSKFIEEAKKLRNHFEEYVRNIYEEVSNIPLFLYIDYLSCESVDDIYNEEIDELGITTMPEVLVHIKFMCAVAYED